MRARGRLYGIGGADAIGCACARHNPIAAIGPSTADAGPIGFFLIDDIVGFIVGACIAGLASVAGFTGIAILGFPAVTAAIAALQTTLTGILIAASATALTTGFKLLGDGIDTLRQALYDAFRHIDISEANSRNNANYLATKIRIILDYMLTRISRPSFINPAFPDWWSSLPSPSRLNLKPGASLFELMLTDATVDPMIAIQLKQHEATWYERGLNPNGLTVDSPRVSAWRADQMRQNALVAATATDAQWSASIEDRAKGAAPMDDEQAWTACRALDPSMATAHCRELAAARAARASASLGVAQAAQVAAARARVAARAHAAGPPRILLGGWALGRGT